MICDFSSYLCTFFICMYGICVFYLSFKALIKFLEKFLLKLNLIFFYFDLHFSLDKFDLKVTISKVKELKN